MLDIGLAYLHHLAVFAIVGLLFAEFVLIRPGLNGQQLTRLARLDAAYGISAILVILAGIARVFLGSTGSAYYLSNHVFWTKMLLIVILGLLSIQPTLSIIRWRRASGSDANYLVSDADIKKARRFLHIELFVLFLIPLAAAAMARGVGM